MLSFRGEMMPLWRHSTISYLFGSHHETWWVQNWIRVVRRNGMKNHQRRTRKQLQEARAQNKNVRGMVIINPGNPTCQVLGRTDLEMVTKLCADNGIFLLADEVYQRNVYPTDREFICAKKVVAETPGCENVELVSYHSTSSVHGPALPLITRFSLDFF